MSESWQPLLGQVAGVISIAGFAPYAVAIHRGTARPNRVTWITWSVVGAILFASYEVEAGGASRWVPLSDALGPAIVAVLAIRQGLGAGRARAEVDGFSRFDRGCLAFAALSLVVWALSGSAMLALWMCLLIAVLGALPTFRNVLRDPTSEPSLTWRMFLAGNALNLFAIEEWSVASAAYPLYAVTVAAIVNVLISATWLARRRGSPRSAPGTAR